MYMYLQWGCSLGTRGSGPPPARPPAGYGLALTVSPMGSLDHGRGMTSCLPARCAARREVVVPSAAGRTAPSTTLALRRRLDPSE